jgi:hypothetical protein
LAAHGYGMGRFAVLAGFGFLGFALGFFAYLSRKAFIELILRLLPTLDIELVGAVVTGLAGAVIMIAGVIAWSYMTGR